MHVCACMHMHVCACMCMCECVHVYPSRIYRSMDVIVVEWLWMPACIDVVIVKDKHVVV